MGFIKIKDKADLQEKLQENQDEEMVVHYNCSNCDDEQVTYSEPGYDYLEIIEAFGYFVPHIDCTACGTQTRILEIDKIQGIEIWK